MADVRAARTGEEVGHSGRDDMDESAASGATREIGGGLNGVLNFGLQTRRARLPIRGTSGSVQRGPANPARPGREQRYRVSQVCRGDPEVPRFGKTVLSCQF